MNLNDGWFSVSVGFVLLWDFKGSFVLLRDFNDGWFCSGTRFQWQLVLFGLRDLVTSVLYGYEISVTAGFVRLRNLNDGHLFSFVRFRWQSVLLGYESQWRLVFSVSRFCSVMILQRRSVLFLCSFMKFHRQSVLFSYEISIKYVFSFMRF